MARIKRSRGLLRAVCGAVLGVEGVLDVMIY
jgi:hypothetical protein